MAASMAGQPEPAGMRPKGSALLVAATMPELKTPNRLSPTIRPEASRMPRRLAMSP